MKWAWVAAMAAMLTASPAAAQLGEIDLQPAGSWTLHKAPELCRVSRDFTAGGRAYSLHIRSHGPQGAYEVRAVGPTLLKDDQRARQIEAGFVSDNDNAPLQPVIAIAASSSGDAMLIFQASVRRPGTLFLRGRWDGPARSAVAADFSADALLLQGAGMPGHRFALTDMGQAQSLLDGCDAELPNNWGFDTQVQTGLTRLPRLLNGQNVGYWIIYPPNLLLNRVSTIVQFRLKVLASGMVSDCVIQTNNWDAKATRQTCQAFMEDARFEPALNAAGEPVDALFRGSYMMVMFD